MTDLGLHWHAVGADSVAVGYSCPCGCTPAVTYTRGKEVVREGCCCGNEFAVGPDAAAQVPVQAGFELRRAAVDAPWHASLPVAWAIGPSVHAGESETPGAADHPVSTTAVDPVCGMTVDVATALQKGLHRRHEGIDYSFCGKGCALEFTDDPAHYLAADYRASM